LGQAARRFMESRFGYDFGGVRVFHDDAAAASARAISANAYTVGEKIVFSQGKYAPDSRNGRRLLAHELTHVVQQSGGGLRPRAPADPVLENEAEGASRRVHDSGTIVNVRRRTGLGIARDPSGSEQKLIEVHLPEGTKQLTAEEFASYKQRALNILRIDLRLASDLADNGRRSQESLLAEYQGGVESLTDILKKPKALIGIAADIKAGVTPPYIGAWSNPKNTARLGLAACDRGDLAEAAHLLRQAESEYKNALHQWNAYREATIGGAEAVASNLETVRDVSFAIALAAGAAVAAPAIAAGVGAGGLGATGATATVLTTGGTTLVTGAGGAVLGGGSTALGSKLATGKVDVKAVKQDAIKYGKQGVVTGLTAGLGSSLGAANAAEKLAQPAVQAAAKRCLTEAGVNVAGEVTTQTLDAIASPPGTTEKTEGAKPLAPGPARAALTGCLSGALGVPVAKLGQTGGKVSDLAVTAGTGYLDARLAGQSNEEALLAAGQSTLTSALVARGHAGSEQAKAAKTIESRTTEQAKTARPFEEQTPPPHPDEPLGKSPAPAKQTAAVEHKGIPAATKPSEPAAKSPSERFLEKQKATTDSESVPAVMKEEVKAKKPLPDGHEVVVTEHGVGRCSGPPCPVIHIEYAKELTENPELKPWNEAIHKLRKTDPARAATEGKQLINVLEHLRSGGVDSDSSPGVGLRQKALAAQEAIAESEISTARQEALEYAAQRRVEGKRVAGGPIKHYWNVKERIWALKRQQAHPERTLLSQATIVGVKSPDGNLRTTELIGGKGRIPDYVEIRGSQVVAGDLKSISEFKKSIAGGIKSGPVEAEFRVGKKGIGAQQKVEKKVLEEALKSGGKIIIRGRDVLTGEFHEMEVDPSQYASEVLTYEEIYPN
jgi:hypothetical protein